MDMYMETGDFVSNKRPNPDAEADEQGPAPGEDQHPTSNPLIDGLPDMVMGALSAIAESNAELGVRSSLQERPIVSQTNLSMLGDLIRLPPGKDISSFAAFGACPYFVLLSDPATKEVHLATYSQPLPTTAADRVAMDPPQIVRDTMLVHRLHACDPALTFISNATYEEQPARITATVVATLCFEDDTVVRHLFLTVYLDEASDRSLAPWSMDPVLITALPVKISVGCTLLDSCDLTGFALRLNDKQRETLVAISVHYWSDTQFFKLSFSIETPPSDDIDDMILDCEGLDVSPEERKRKIALRMRNRTRKQDQFTQHRCKDVLFAVSLGTEGPRFMRADGTTPADLREIVQIKWQQSNGPTGICVVFLPTAQGEEIPHGLHSFQAMSPLRERFAGDRDNTLHGLVPIYPPKSLPKLRFPDNHPCETRPFRLPVNPYDQSKINVVDCLVSPRFAAVPMLVFCSDKCSVLSYSDMPGATLLRTVSNPTTVMAENRVHCALSYANAIMVLLSRHYIGTTVQLDKGQLDAPPAAVREMSLSSLISSNKFTQTCRFYNQDTDTWYLFDGNTFKYVGIKPIPDIRLARASIMAMHREMRAVALAPQSSKVEPLEGAIKPKMSRVPRNKRQ